MNARERRTDYPTRPDSMGCSYRIVGNNIDMIGYNPTIQNNSFWMLLGLRRAMKAEGFTARASDYGKGYLVSRSDYAWTAFTVYLDGTEKRFTLYAAIPDIWKAIDIEDEKLIAKNLTVSQAVETMLKTEKDWELQNYYETRFGTEYE